MFYLRHCCMSLLSLPFTAKPLKRGVHSHQTLFSPALLNLTRRSPLPPCWKHSYLVTGCLHHDKCHGQGSHFTVDCSLLETLSLLHLSLCDITLSTHSPASVGHSFSASLVLSLLHVSKCWIARAQCLDRFSS